MLDRAYDIIPPIDELLTFIIHMAVLERALALAQHMVYREIVVDVKL